MAALLRMHRISADAMGVDELFSVHFSTGRGPWETALQADKWMQPAEDIQSIDSAAPWWRIWTSMGFDTHPPLHPMALRLWMTVFGETDVWARSLSVIFSLLTLVLLFDAARTTAGVAAGLWAAAICTFAGPQIEFAQECRSYMMLTMLAAAAVAIAARIIVQDASWRLSGVFAAVALVMMLTHYWAIGILAPLLIVIVAAKQGRARWRPVVACAVAGLVFAVVWGPFLLQQRANFANNMGWIADTDPGLFLRSLRRLAVLPLRLLFEPAPSYLRNAETGSGLAWAAPAFMYLIAVAAVRQRTCWVWIASFLGPVVLVLAADLSQQRQTLNLVRYTLPASVGLYGLLAVAAARCGWIAHLIPGAAVLACLGALPMAWQRDKPPWRDFAMQAAAQMTEHDALVLIRDPNNKWLGAIVYMAVNRYTHGLPCAAVVLDGPADATIMSRLRAAQRIVIISDMADPPVQRFVPGSQPTARAAWLPRAGSYAQIRFENPTTMP